MKLTELVNNLRKDFSGLVQLRVGVLGETSTQFFSQALRGLGYERGFDLQVTEAAFDQIQQQATAKNSDLYAHDPEFIVILKSSEVLFEKFCTKAAVQITVFFEEELAAISRLIDAISDISPTSTILITNFPEIDDAVFGNFANKTHRSFLYAVRKINVLLMELAQKRSCLSILDASAIQNAHGRFFYFDERLYVNAALDHSLDAVPEIARAAVDIICAANGVIKKCLILDLDNTLWGGVIGDDGLEKIELGDLGSGKAFLRLQRWIKQLQMRGILLAVCSKNSEETAKEPFLRHPDMQLRLDDISVFVANWNSKVDNIRYIQSVLNIGLDSMVFLDDNPFERNLVRNSLPDVYVPELPEDPAEFLQYIQRLNLFEATSLTEEDSRRTKQIQDKLRTDKVHQSFTSDAEFLASLHMKAVISGFTPFIAPRVAQLSQRSNQFNLRTVRYSEADVAKLAISRDTICIAVNLRDDLADHGLISVVVLKVSSGVASVENWFMSCRVLGRGVERAVLNHIVSLAGRLNFQSISGKYIPTPKNSLVKDHYRNLKFDEGLDGNWTLDTLSFLPHQHNISIEIANG